MKTATTSFRHHGKEYRLWKREDSRAASWYFTIKQGGKKITRSMDSNEVEVAAVRARAMIDAVKGERWQAIDETRAKTPSATVAGCPTFGTLIDTYMLLPVRANLNTRKGYLEMLNVVLKNAGLDRSSFVSELTPEVVARHFATAQTKAHGLDQRGAQRVMVSANSVMNQALAFFSQAAMDQYREAGLSLPDMEPVLSKFRARKFKGVEVKYSAPSQAIIDASLAEWPTLPVDMQMAIGLTLCFGLRLGEAAQAQWSWLKSVDGYAVLDGNAHVKNGSGVIFSRGLDPFFQTWIKLCPKQREGHIIPGSDSQRNFKLWRRLGDWMEGKGWQTTKKAHAWRALYGSLVALRYGIHEACTRLRHSSVTTTERAYTHFLDRRSLAQRDSLPYQWAAWAGWE